MKPILVLVPAGLAGLVVLDASAAPPSAASVWPQDKARLELELPRKASFRVQRARVVAPGGVDAPGAGVPVGIASDVRYDLRRQSVTTSEPGHGPWTTFLLDVIGLDERAPVGRLGAIQGDGELPEASAPAETLLGRLRIQVDERGHILRLEDLATFSGDADDALHAASLAGLDPLRLQSDLAILLGTGLHDHELREGMPYELVTPPSADAEADGAEAGFVLRFDGVRAALPVAGAGSVDAKEAAFIVLAPDAAASASDDPSVAEGRLGRAVYSLRDGLVTRFELQPRRPEEGAADGPRITIERVPER
jgi:hypothetical protein